MENGGHSEAGLAAVVSFELAPLATLAEMEGSLPVTKLPQISGSKLAVFPHYSRGTTYS